MDLLVMDCIQKAGVQGAEISYPTVEKELLAVVYLFVKSEVSSILQWWIMSVQESQFTVKHVPGKTNVVADVLSRYVVSHPLDEEEDPLQDLYPAFVVSKSGSLYESYLEDILHYVMTGVQTVV
ncbi:hypothetical protein BGW37DRAFT_544910 [Umbelopsis sp. PMI_123]|nr:hypothetical protein BGW37DRAFT_544910 [Umbelopsis sp. PMI_123]